MNIVERVFTTIIQSFLQIFVQLVKGLFMANTMQDTDVKPTEETEGGNDDS